MGKFSVIKTYGHDLGISCCFRQYKAKSHCQYLHGYALAFEFCFSANELDKNNWVIDFGDLKEIKEWLFWQFDHRLLLSNRDPLCKQLNDLNKFADVNIVKSVGCESFALWVFLWVADWLEKKGHSPRVGLDYVKVSEHGGNSAIFRKDNT